MSIRFATIIASLLTLAALAPEAGAQSSPAPMTSASSGSILLTILLKHDQSKNLGEINAQLAKNGYYKQFPPQGIEVVSWYVTLAAN